MKPNSKEDRIFGINPNCRFVFSLVYKIPPCGFGNHLRLSVSLDNARAFPHDISSYSPRISMFTSRLDNES